MKIISLDVLARETAYVEAQKRNLTASVGFDDLAANLKLLQSRHEGMYAFLAFHPTVDVAVANYLVPPVASSGADDSTSSVGMDAGADIMLLMLSKAAAPQARNITREDLGVGVQIKREAHRAYKLASRFFPTGRTPRFPGLILFDKLIAPEESIYVFLDNADENAVRMICRKAFEATRACYDPNGKGLGKPAVDFPRLAARLYTLEIPYARCGENGVRSASLLFGAWIVKNAKAIVTAIPKLVGAAKTVATGGAS